MAPLGQADRVAAQMREGAGVEGYMAGLAQKNGAVMSFLRTDGGWMNAPDTALYNWDDESWLALDSPQLGINDITFVDGLMNDQGKIRLRVSAQVNGGGCIYLGMGISGTKP